MSTEHSIYGSHSDWYRLLDPPEDHALEAEQYSAIIRAHAVGEVKTLLELGSGAGHNAVHLKREFDCTLTDISTEMLDLSRALNPGCEHQLGDMRDIRLGREFDAVLVHDAVMYMKTEHDLKSTIRSAALHLRKGGVVLFAPDFFADDFRESTWLHEAAEGQRSMKCLEWCWDPDPSDTVFRTDYGFLLRDGDTVVNIHEIHEEGIFHRDTWHGLVHACGFEGATFASRELKDEEADAYTTSVVIGRRPTR